jgi:hypothetical protein
MKTCIILHNMIVEDEGPLALNTSFDNIGVVLTLLKVQWKSATISSIKGITNSKTETNILSFRLILSTIIGRVLAPELHRRRLIAWYLNKMTTLNQNVIVYVLVLLCHVR